MKKTYLLSLTIWWWKEQLIYQVFCRTAFQHLANLFKQKTPNQHTWQRYFHGANLQGILMLHTVLSQDLYLLVISFKFQRNYSASTFHLFIFGEALLSSQATAISIFLQDLFQVNVLMTLGMSNIPIQNKDGLYFFFWEHIHLSLRKMWQRHQTLVVFCSRLTARSRLSCQILFKRLLIFHRNLSDSKLSVYKKFSSKNPGRLALSSAEKSQQCIQLFLHWGFHIFQLHLLPVLLFQWSINSIAQTFPLDKQELIQINSFCYYFFSVSKESPFQDYKHVFILPLNRSLLYLDKNHQIVLLKHSEARLLKSQ